eukprot:1686906-Rhodomonas_salina.2
MECGKEKNKINRRAKKERRKYTICGKEQCNIYPYGASQTSARIPHEKERGLVRAVEIWGRGSKERGAEAHARETGRKDNKFGNAQAMKSKQETGKAWGPAAT